MGKVGLNCGSWASAVEELLFPSQRPGEEAPWLIAGWLLGSELGPRWVLVCMCQMLCDMGKVLELRLILRQPSPLWLSFTVEELQIYQQGPKVSD